MDNSDKKAAIIIGFIREEIEKLKEKMDKGKESRNYTNN